MATNNEQIKNKDQALDIAMEISRYPRSGWITRGSQTKSNEKIEISRNLANELANKALCFYQVLDQLPGNPFCNCKQVEELLQKVNEELPAGDTADEFEQLMLNYCPVCGKKFE